MIAPIRDYCPSNLWPNQIRDTPTANLQVQWLSKRDISLWVSLWRVKFGFYPVSYGEDEQNPASTFTHEDNTRAKIKSDLGIHWKRVHNQHVRSHPEHSMILRSMEIRYSTVLIIYIHYLLCYPSHFVIGPVWLVWLVCPVCIISAIRGGFPAQCPGQWTRSKFKGNHPYKEENLCIYILFISHNIN